MKKTPSIQEKREKQTRNLKNTNTEQFKVDLNKEQQNCIHNLTKLEFLSDHCIIEWTMKKHHQYKRKGKNKQGI